MPSYGLEMCATISAGRFLSPERQSSIMELVIGGTFASSSCELLSMGGLGGLLSCLDCCRRSQHLSC